MILDSHGQPLHRAIGFIRAYSPEPVRKVRLRGNDLYVVGFLTPVEDDEEEDAARTQKRMRRTYQNRMRSAC